MQGAFRWCISMWLEGHIQSDSLHCMQGLFCWCISMWLEGNMLSDACVACRVCSAGASAAPLGSACDPEGDFILQAVAAGPPSAPRHGNHGHALPPAGPGPSPAANPHWAASIPCEQHHTIHLKPLLQSTPEVGPSSSKASLGSDSFLCHCHTMKFDAR